MAKTIILRSFTLIAYVALITLASATSKSDPSTQPTTTVGFTTLLIHRDSPQSPFYDPSLSPFEHLVKAVKRSYNRIHRFKAFRHPTGSPQSDIVKANGEYLITYSIGTPPTPSLGVADTGTDIIWTQCQRCLKCFKQKLPLFKPNNSSTYQKIPCKNPKCKSFGGTQCSRNGRNCMYSQEYADGSFTQGVLGEDTLTLSSTEGKNVISLPNVTFGCGHKNNLSLDTGASGIVGLGAGENSLVQQLGPLAQGKFSYCLVSFSDVSESSKISFGANAEVAGTEVVSTPLVLKESDTFYYLTLEGISVGNNTMIKYNVSTDIDQEGNIIIDSGTTLTFLPYYLYNKLESALKSSINLKQIKDSQGIFSLCYRSRGNIQDVLPDVIFHFKGADVKLKEDNIFVRTSDVSVCLAFQSVMDEEDLVYGNLAQINFLVGYDLLKRTVSFKATDCGRS